MKLRKLLSLVVAVAMVCTLAISVSATVNLKVEGAEDWDKIHVVGGSATRPICFTLVRAVRFTFDIKDQHCGPSADEPDAPPCNKKCVGVVAHGGPAGWSKTETMFCYRDSKTKTINLNDHGWGNGQIDGTDYWLEVAAGSWAPGNDGPVKVEILGDGNKVLAVGAGCDNPDCAGSRNCGVAGTTTSRNTNRDLDTGAGGVAILGAVAVLAAGAVVTTRRRK